MRFLSLKSREFRELQLSSSTLFQIRPSSNPKLHHKVPAAKEKKERKISQKFVPTHIFNHSTHNPILHYLDKIHIILLHTSLSRQSVLFFLHPLTPLSTFIINILSHFLTYMDSYLAKGRTPHESLKERRRAWSKRACCRERKYLSATYFSSSCIIVSFLLKKTIL
ncbi:hypothetical protein LguiB_001008 [Lonicera macranthoides]